MVGLLAGGVPVGCSVRRLNCCRRWTGWLAGWLVCLMVGLLVDGRLVGWLVSLMVELLVRGGLVGWST